jgi:hypothetical protein
MAQFPLLLGLLIRIEAQVDADCLDAQIVVGQSATQSMV